MLAEKPRLHADLKLVQRALKEKWPITQEVMDRLFSRVADIALQNPDDAVALKAVDSVLKMQAANMRAEPVAQEVEHKHLHAVAVCNVESDAASNDYKQRLLAKINRVGSSG